MRTGASERPESRRSGCGRSMCSVRATPTLPTRSETALDRDRDLAPLEVEGFEQRDAEAGQARVAPVARTLGRDAQDVLHAARPLAEEDDTVREIDGLIEVVRHEHECRTVPHPCGYKVVLQLHPREGIERAERLIEEQDLRLGHQCAGESSALRH